MKNSIRVLASIILALGLHNAWAADPKAADKPAAKPTAQQGAAPKSGMQQGQMNGMNMDKEHMQQMHEQMNEMHETHQHGRETCDMKSDGKCAEHGVRAMGAPAEEKSKTSKAK